MRSLTQLQRETLRHLSAICPLRAGPSSQPKRRFVVACALVCHIRPNGPQSAVTGAILELSNKSSVATKERCGS